METHEKMRMYAIQSGIWTLLKALIYRFLHQNILTMKTRTTHISNFATVEVTHVGHVDLEGALDFLVF